MIRLILAALLLCSAPALAEGQELVTICHVPPGNPGNAHEITVANPAVIQAHLNHGDYLGECEGSDDSDEDSEDNDGGPDDDCDDDDCNDDKVLVCHIPPGNPENAHEILVSANAVPALLAHGDILGECPDDNDAGPDGGSDAGTDGGTDGGLDAGPNGGPDAGNPECVLDLDCSDGIFCNGVESCIDGECVDGAAPCEDYCEESLRLCFECKEDSECDDQTFCNGEEVCYRGACFSENPPCAEDEICDENRDVCIPPPECSFHSDCDNGVFCDGRERCVNRVCVAGNWPCELDQLCAEGHGGCVDIRVTPGDGGTPGTPVEPEPEPEDEELTLSGTSPFGCSSSGGTGFGMLIALAFAFLLFRRKTTPVMMAALLMLSVPAYAEGTDHFQAANGPQNYIVTEDSVTLDHLETSGWLVGDYALRPLVIRNQDGQIVGDVVTHQAQVQAAISLGLFDWLELGFAAPGYYLNGPGLPGQDLNGLAFGDPRISAKFMLTPWKEGFVAAFRVRGDLPLAQFNHSDLAGAILGDTHFGSFTPSFMLGFNHDWFKVGTEIGHTFRIPKVVGPTVIGSGLRYSVAGQATLIPDVWYLTGDVYGALNYPIPIGGGGTIWGSDRFAFPTEAALGTKVHLGPLAFMVGAATAVIPDYGTPTARVFASVGWEARNEPEPEREPCPLCEEPEPIYIVPAPCPEPEVVECPECEECPECPECEACPAPGKKKLLVIVKPGKIEVLEPVHFEFDKAVIRPISHELLDNVARALEENEDILLLSIEGHTDSVGPNEYNLDLSQSRAAAVKAYLVEAGIAEERLKAVGHGEERPVVTNDSPENRASNRRVEFVIIERE